MKTIIAFLALSMPIMATASTEYQCKFTKVATEQDGITKEKREFSFFVDGNYAYVTGNNGINKVNVTMLNDRDGVVFIESFLPSQVKVTAIENGGRAAHSRHTFIDGDLIAQQFYGQCTKRL